LIKVLTHLGSSPVYPALSAGVHIDQNQPLYQGWLNQLQTEHRKLGS